MTSPWLEAVFIIQWLTRMPTDSIRNEPVKCEHFAITKFILAPDHQLFLRTWSPTEPILTTPVTLCWGWKAAPTYRTCTSRYPLTPPRTQAALAAMRARKHERRIHMSLQLE